MEIPIDPQLHGHYHLRMLRRTFTAMLALSVIATLVGTSWVAYKQFNRSESSNAAEGFALVNHQTKRMGETLDQTRTFIRTDVRRITDLDILLDEWTPRYNRAKMAYQRFDYAIISAEERAGLYFEAQQELTASYHSSEVRSKALLEDAAEFDQYDRWRSRAHETRARALRLVNRLDDMDVSIRKLDLRSGFTIELTSFGEIPSEILALEDDLDEFQAASDNILEVISSPFDLEL